MTHEKKTIKPCYKLETFVSVLGYLLLFVNVIQIFGLKGRYQQRKTYNVVDNIVYNNSSQRHDEQSDGTAACLLIMDGSHLLIEWLAYHYHVLRLRHLIVAVDPRSTTTPTDILKRWVERINIQIWHGEERYINLQKFHQQVENRMEEYHREASNFDLSAHRTRQREFNKECSIAHKMKDRGWTFLIDTDEFIYMNPIKRDQQKFPGWENLSSVDEPDSVYTVLQKLRLPNDSFGMTGPCLRIARRQFSANEDQQNQDIVSHSELNLKNFQTIRWRKWGFHDPHHPCLAGKTIIDLRRLKLVDIIAEENYGDPHVPLPIICPKEDVFATEDEVILLANHYMGTAEQWNFRTNDARGSECMRRLYDHYNAIVGKYESNDVSSWLEGFIGSIGMDEAVLLLEGVGVVESVPNLEKIEQFNNDDGSGEAGEQEYKEPFKIGERILYVYEDKWYIGTILASNCRGGYDVRYDDAPWDYNLGVEEMILLSLGATNL